MNRKHMCAFIPHLKDVGIPAYGSKSYSHVSGVLRRYGNR
jgi:hypothetical protein